MAVQIASKSSPDAVAFGRLKKYPAAGQFELMSSSRPVFRLPGWERRKSPYELEQEAIDRQLHLLGWEHDAEGSPPLPEKEAANRARAARRAASALRDLALSNEFTWFVTLTLDQSKIDRYDIQPITRKLNQWLDNCVRRLGLKYVLVPEYHKDGAIHFHGLFSEVPGFVPSGTWNVPGHKKPIKPRSKAEAARWAEAGYQQIFNFDRWALGFSTGIRLYGEYERAVGYVCKYIRKQITPGEGVTPGKIGGRWYYSGGELARPEVEYVQLDILWMRENCPEAYYFDIPEASAEFGIYRGRYIPGAEFSAPEAEFTKAGLSNPAKNPENPGFSGNSAPEVG